jgi:hypothetical protein
MEKYLEDTDEQTKVGGAFSEYKSILDELMNMNRYVGGKLGGNDSDPQIFSDVTDDMLYDGGAKNESDDNVADIADDVIESPDNVADTADDVGVSIIDFATEDNVPEDEDDIATEDNIATEENIATEDNVPEVAGGFYSILDAINSGKAE